MLPDDWVRVQVYMPEEIRYRFRLYKPEGMHESDYLRRILSHIIRTYSEEDILEVLFGE